MIKTLWSLLRHFMTIFGLMLVAASIVTISVMKDPCTKELQRYLVGNAIYCSVAK